MLRGKSIRALVCRIALSCAGRWGSIIAAVGELPSGMAERFHRKRGVRAVGPTVPNVLRPVATCLPSVSRWLQTAIWEVSSAL